MLLAGTGLGCAVLGSIRWFRTERAIRLEQPLPGGALLGVIGAATALVAIVVVVCVGTR